VLSCECDIQATDYNGDTALHHATNNDKRKAVALLIEKGIDIDSTHIMCETALYNAIRHDFIELAELLLKGGISIVAKESSEQMTALHLAVVSGNIALIWLLLSQESINHIVNAKDKRGQTPLHYACLGRKPKIVKLLLGAGTHIDALNATGQTPLQSMIFEATKNQWQRSYIRDRDFIEVVNLLLEAGADTTGVTVTEELGKIYPKLANALLNGSREVTSQKKAILNGPLEIEHDHILEMDASSMLLKEFRYTSTSLGK
jgi:ankyrin repeat protein